MTAAPQPVPAFEVERLAGALGAEIAASTSRSPLDDPTQKEIHDAWMEHQVLFLRGQRITREQHKDFARSFGELHVHPVLQQLAERGASRRSSCSRATRRAVRGGRLAQRRHLRAQAAAWARSCARSRRRRLRRRHDVGEHVRGLRGALRLDAAPALGPARAFHDGGDFFNYDRRRTRRRSRTLAPGQRRGAPGDPHAPGDGPQGDLRELDLHEGDRRHEARREPRAARPSSTSTSPRPTSRALPLGDGLDRDVGQPLHAAPRAARTRCRATGAWSA